MDLDDCMWWIHQDCLLHVLGVECCGILHDTIVHHLVELLTKGKLNLKNEDIKMTLEGYRTLISFGDLNIENDLLFWTQVSRNKSEKRIRWFTKGKKTCSLRLQKILMNDIIGHDSYHRFSTTETRNRCQFTYLAWYYGDRQATKSFKKYDMNIIVNRYPDIFPSHETLNEHTAPMKKCLFYSNIIPLPLLSSNTTSSITRSLSTTSPSPTSLSVKSLSSSLAWDSPYLRV